MAKKLYPLRNVPDDEANEMRALLREHDIAFHETHAGVIGIGTAAIWIDDEAQFDSAKTLIKSYQQQRYQKARSDYEAQKEAQIAPRLIDLFWQNPKKFVLFCVFALALLLLTTLPFWF